VNIRDSSPQERWEGRESPLDIEVPFRFEDTVRRCQEGKVNPSGPNSKLVLTQNLSPPPIQIETGRDIFSGKIQKSKKYIDMYLLVSFRQFVGRTLRSRIKVGAMHGRIVSRLHNSLKGIPLRCLVEIHNDWAEYLRYFEGRGEGRPPSGTQDVVRWNM
jgi:hypothetical protein